MAKTAATRSIFVNVYRRYCVLAAGYCVSRKTLGQDRLTCESTEATSNAPMMLYAMHDLDGVNSHGPE